MEVHVAFCGGVRVRVHRADRVCRLYFVLQEADDRRHQVRGLRELRAPVGRWPVLEQCWSCGFVHVRAGADHAVPVGFDGVGAGFDEVAWHEVLPHLHLPALRGAGCGVDFDLGFRVRREVRPGGFVERFPGHGHRRARPFRVVGQHREHRDVGVHGLQHAHLLQLAVDHPAFPV